MIMISPKLNIFTAAKLQKISYKPTKYTNFYMESNLFVKNHIFITKSLQDSKKSYIFAFSYQNGDGAVFLYRYLAGC